MAQKELKSIKFPGLEDVYKIPAGGSGGTGQDGKDGITPTIGANGNWYLGDEDTGKPSRGAPGKDGSPGKDGAPGKDGVTPDIKIGTVTTLPAGSEATASMGGTAAQPTLNLGIPKGADGDDANVTRDAVVGALGFTPISADDVPVKSVNGATGAVKSTFYVTVTPTGSGYAATADKTAAEVYAAYAAGYAVYAIVNFPAVHVPFELPLVAAASASGTIVLGFSALGSVDPTKSPQYPTASYTGTAWMAWLGTLARSSDIPTIPTELKNPHSLNIKIGNATTSYDGSAEKTVEIPKGVPAVTAADNGKILRVVKGAWEAVEIANANGGSF